MKSFSQELKHLICEKPLRRQCCLKAFLTGVLTAKGTSDGETVTVRVFGKEAAEFLSAAISQLWGKTPEVRRDRSAGVSLLLTFSANGALELMDEIETGSLESVYQQECKECDASFLRGVFLVCGRIRDPQKGFLLEFSAGDRIDMIEQYFWQYELMPRRSDRKGEKLLILSGGAAIEYFFVLIQENSRAFSVMDKRIELEIKREINRQINCDTNNIKKSVAASREQIDAILRIRSAGMMDDLPADLRQTALVRLDHPDKSIQDLLPLISPPVTKSGLAHRLRKLVEIADHLPSEGS